MELVSIGLGVLVLLVLGGLGAYVGKLFRSSIIAGLLFAGTIALAFMAYRYMGPWVALTLALKSPGNPLYAIAQRSPDVSDMLQLELYNAYLRGGQAEMERKARELGREYIREQNIFLGVANADDATVNETFSFFRMVLARGETAAPEKCGEFLGGGTTVAFEDLGLTSDERTQANATMTKILSLPKADDRTAPPPWARDGGPALQAILRRLMGGRDFDPELIDRNPAELDRDQKIMKCKTVNRLFEALDGAPEPARLRLIRGLFARMGQS